jgi:putative ABC transport system permease protein
VPRSLQLSHWFVANELLQLRTFGLLLPSIFLIVAAFTLNVALSRVLALQRAQIAALKALGYGHASIAWHYVKLAIVIALGGLLVGVAAGAWLGAALGGLYNDVFRFPDLRFQIPWRVVGAATVLTTGAAAAGAWAAVRTAVAVPPAEAMRPEAPPRYRRSVVETALGARLGASGRMVLRHLYRRPLRATASVVGIALGVAVLMVGLVFSEVIDRIVVMQFSTVEREDATVAFSQPRSAEAIHALARLPGVMAVEPERTVAVRLHAGHRQRNVVLTGIAQDARLRRIVDARGRAMAPPPAGLVLSRVLADALGVAPGEALIVEVLEGRRPTCVVTVAGLVDDVFGVAAYLDLAALHRLLGEGNLSTGATMLVDRGRERMLARALDRHPAVAGTSFKSRVAQSFRDTMSKNLGVTTLINLLFAAVIAVGVVYNAARVSLSEHSRELASLRVLGFTRAEISLVLLGELAVLTLAAIPVGWLLGYGLAWAMVKTSESEVYRIPLHIATAAVARASLAILAAALASGLVARRRLDRLDLVAALKIQE